jgi:hypothetical protein
VETVTNKTLKETVDYDAGFLKEWNTFCDTKGYVKRQAAHACRIAFMKLFSTAQREKAVHEVQEHIRGLGEK